MHIPVDSAAQIGSVLRLVRKAQGVRSDDLAGTAGVGPVFVLDVEKGKPTIQLGKLLQVLREAGVKVSLEIPDNLDLEALRVGPRKRLPQQHMETILARNGSETWASSVAQAIADGQKASGNVAADGRLSRNPSIG